MKRQRQQALLDLIHREPVGNQEEIRKRLAALGHDATQSTISRDLEELGLVRLRDAEGRFRYREPSNGSVHPPVPLRTLLQEFALAIEPSGNLVMIKTPPGAANALAEGLDQADLPELLGTVAGDNTILLVARQGARKGQSLARRLRALAGLS